MRRLFIKKLEFKIDEFSKKSKFSKVGTTHPPLVLFAHKETLYMYP
jgi:hypothetical protein